jgi:protein disulfide-isomerase-like protein
MFYAPWCGHCTHMKPFYHEAAKLLRDDATIKTDKPVVLSKLDATVEKLTAAKFEIQGYPTLKIFRKGIAYDYDGPRQDAKAIAKYLAKESSNDWKPPKSAVRVLVNDNFTEFTSQHELSLVEFYSPK